MKRKRLAQLCDIRGGVDRARQLQPVAHRRRVACHRLRRLAQIIQHVPQLGSPFKIQLRRRRAHLQLQLVEQFLRAPLHEFARPRHPFAILLRRDVRQLHRHLIRAAPQLPLRRRPFPKRQHAELLPHKSQRLP
jgi:hypothetical protein